MPPNPEPASDSRPAPPLQTATAHSPGGDPHASATSPGFFSDFIPISEAVARVVGRVRRQRERLDEDEAAIVARHPVTDPEDDAVARAFAEPEIGG